jgi:hypothetical protein
MKVNAVAVAVLLSTAAATTALPGSPTRTAAAAGPNERPLAEAGLDRTVEVGASVPLDATGSRDPDGSIEGYRWRVETPDGDTAAPVCRDCPRTRFRPDTPGTYTVVLTVTDDDGATATDRLYVEVTGDAGSDQNATDSGGSTGDSGQNADGSTEPTELAVDVSGPNRARQGTVATFRATVTPGDAPVETLTWSVASTTVERAGGVTTDRFDFRPSMAGRTRVVATVTDAEGRIDRDSISVLATSDEYANRPSPSIGAPVSGDPQTSNDAPSARLAATPDPVCGDGTPVSLDARGSTDADGSVVTHIWDTDGDGRYGDASGPTTTVTWTNPTGSTETRTATVRVTDGAGATDTATETIRVRPATSCTDGGSANDGTTDSTADDPTPVDSPAPDSNDGPGTSGATETGLAPVELELADPHFVDVQRGGGAARADAEAVSCDRPLDGDLSTTPDEEYPDSSVNPCATTVQTTGVEYVWYKDGTRFATGSRVASVPVDQSRYAGLGPGETVQYGVTVSVVARDTATGETTSDSAQLTVCATGSGVDNCQGGATVQRGTYTPPDPARVANGDLTVAVGESATRSLTPQPRAYYRYSETNWETRAAYQTFPSPNDDQSSLGGTSVTFAPEEPTQFGISVDVAGTIVDDRNGTAVTTFSDNFDVDATCPDGTEDAGGKCREKDGRPSPGTGPDRPSGAPGGPASPGGPTTPGDGSGSSSDDSTDPGGRQTSPGGPGGAALPGGQTTPGNDPGDRDNSGAGSSGDSSNGPDGNTGGPGSGFDPIDSGGSPGWSS